MKKDIFKVLMRDFLTQSISPLAIDSPYEDHIGLSIMKIIIGINIKRRIVTE